MFLLQFSMLSCERNCEPAFPEELIDWLPYSGVSKIEFTSSGDSVLSFDIIKNYIPKEECYGSGWSFAVLGVRNLELIAVDSVLDVTLKCELSSDLTGPELGLSACLYSKDINKMNDQLYSFYKKFYENSSTSYENVVYPPLDSMEIGGTLYKNVYQLIRDNESTEATPHFNKMYIVKGIGFVGLEQSNGRVWYRK